MPASRSLRLRGGVTELFWASRFWRPPIDVNDLAEKFGTEVKARPRCRMVNATDVDDLAQGTITAEAVAAQARDVTEVSNAQSYAELPQLAALLMAADAVQAAQARNPSISNFAFFICGAEREDLHGNGDARSLDHTTLEELRMHAVRSVQAGERPSGCRSSFECQ
jgi:hypothetical protein